MVRGHHKRIATHIHDLVGQIDGLMLQRESLLRENIDLKMDIMDLLEQNYRLKAALFEEKSERARDHAVGELEVQHLIRLYQHRIEDLEKGLGKL